MPRYNEYVVEKVATAMISALSDYYETTPARDATFLDTFRVQAEAALAAIDSLYESEAEEPVEYAGIEGGL